MPSDAESERRPTSLVPNDPLQTLATPKYSGGDECVRAMPCTMSMGDCCKSQTVVASSV